MLPQSFHSCFSKLSSKTQTFAENKYTEFLISMSSGEEIWNPGSEGTVLITDCSRILVPVQKPFLTFMCWFSVGCLGDDHCIAHEEFCVLNDFREVAVNVLCCLSMSISLLFHLLWAECVCVWFCEGLWNPSCLRCLIQVSMYLFGTCHHCFLFSPVLVSAVLIAVCLAVPIHSRHSEFFSRTFKRWGTIPFPAQQHHLLAWQSVGFLTSDFYMDISSHNVSSCSVVSTLQFRGRVPQLISGHLCSDSSWRFLRNWFNWGIKADAVLLFPGVLGLIWNWFLVWTDSGWWLAKNSFLAGFGESSGAFCLFSSLHCFAVSWDRCSSQCKRGVGNWQLEVKLGRKGRRWLQSHLEQIQQAASEGGELLPLPAPCCSPSGSFAVCWTTSWVDSTC